MAIRIFGIKILVSQMEIDLVNYRCKIQNIIIQSEQPFNPIRTAAFLRHYLPPESQLCQAFQTSYTRGMNRVKYKYLPSGPQFPIAGVLY